MLIHIHSIPKTYLSINRLFSRNTKYIKNKYFKYYDCAPQVLT